MSIAILFFKSNAFIQKKIMKKYNQLLIYIYEIKFH